MILRLAAGAAMVAGCNGPAIPEAYLIIGWPALDFRVPQGAAGSVTVLVDRTPDYDRHVRVTARNLPKGVTSRVTATTVDGTTTSIVTLHVAANVPLGKYYFTMVVSGQGVLDANRQMFLYVVEPPAYSMTVARPTLNVSRGGAAPLAITFTRTNFATPITLSVSGNAGITASFPVNPVAADQAEGLLSISGSALPGTHTITLRGVAAPLPDRTVQLSVTVSEDHLQVFVDSAVDARQGSTTRKAIVVNRSDAAGSVSVAAEGLPPGVTASFVPEGSHAYVMSLAVLPSVATGSHTVTLRVTGTGVPDATATFQLTITPSRVALAIAPDTLHVFQGTSDGAVVTLQRTGLDTTVAISFEGVPSGLTVSASPANVTGNSTTATVSVDASVTPGPQSLTVVATPAGWGSADATRKALRVNVREVPAGGGNVILDWGACTPPSWVAAQDANGGWTRVQPVGGVFRFTVNGSRGGFAYYDASDTLFMRYMTKAELTAEPLEMCPPVVPTKTITGTGVPTGATEQVTHNFGGARATSSASSPNFTLAGVRPGVHDLVSWATLTSLGQRALIMRDIDLSDGESVGFVETTGPDAFAPIQATLLISGTLAGEAVWHTQNFLTTAACTVNPVYDTGGILATGVSFGTLMFGVPDVHRRPSDFHMVTASSSTAIRTRTTSLVFQRIENRTVQLITQSAVVGVNSLGGSHKRLQAFVSNLSAVYNRSVTLRYRGGSKSVVVNATIGYLTPTTFLTLTVPELGTVTGWNAAFAPKPTDFGSWSVTLEGAAAGPVCSAGYQKVTLRHVGTF